MMGGFRSGASWSGLVWSGLVWSGPKPVLGHGRHRYFFQVVALRENVQAPGGGALLSKEALLRGQGPCLGRVDRDIREIDTDSQCCWPGKLKIRNFCHQIYCQEF
jgi:Phosphatidylethanolamine-binding protein